MTTMTTTGKILRRKLRETERTQAAARGN